MEFQTKILNEIFNTNNIEFDKIKFIKFIFLYNALDNGWTIKKQKNNSYKFYKFHKGKKEVLNENYLSTFIRDNINNTFINFDKI